MRNILSIAVTATLLAGYATGASTLKLTGVGDSGTLAGVYVGPYEGEIDGVAAAIICDDFAAVTLLGQTWKANVTTVASLNDSNVDQTRWGSIDKYQQAAWLALKLTSEPAGSAGALQFAIWKLFSPNAVMAQLASHSVSSDQIDKWLTLAEQEYKGSVAEYANVYIYTPTRGMGKSPQEMLVVRTLEPSGILVLSLTLIGIAGLCWFNRRTPVAGQLR